MNDLKQIPELVDEGKEGYQAAAEATENPELHGLFSRISGERIVYAAELKEHIALYGEEAENEKGIIMGGLHRAWLNVKQAFSSKEDHVILNAITTGERAAIENTMNALPGMQITRIILNYSQNNVTAFSLPCQKSKSVSYLKQQNVKKALNLSNKHHGNTY